jgi:hypothetical protein
MAEKCRLRVVEYQAKLERANAERKGIKLSDELLPHQIAPAGLGKMRVLFLKYPLLEMVYLSQKKVREFPESPYFIVGLVPYRRWYKPHWPKKEVKPIAIAGQIELPTSGWVVLLTATQKWLRRKFLVVPGSEIYRRI